VHNGALLDDIEVEAFDGNGALGDNGKVDEAISCQLDQEEGQ